MEENNNMPIEETSPAETKGKKPGPFSGIKDQKGLKAKIKFFFDVLEKYPDARQAVLYVLFSMICGLSQFASQYIVLYTFRLIPSLGESAGKFNWFVFNYNYPAEFIAFLVGAVVGNTMTYILNRKKTFRASNNLALSITLYTIMMVLITIMQAWVPGPITTSCVSTYAANNGGAEPGGFVYFLITLTGTAVGGIAALVISFFGNKFVVMRDWSKKKNTPSEESSEEK